VLGQIKSKEEMLLKNIWDIGLEVSLWYKENPTAPA